MGRIKVEDPNCVALDGARCNKNPNAIGICSSCPGGIEWVESKIEDVKPENEWQVNGKPTFSKAGPRGYQGVVVFIKDLPDNRRQTQTVRLGIRNGSQVGPHTTISKPFKIR